MAQPDNPIEIFISYSHRDKELFQRLVTHLSSLRRPGLIADWHDGQIVPGQQWADEIVRHLNSAKIILLLVSPDFIASYYCFEIEMKRAIERHDSGEAVVLPVILQSCYWEKAPFSKLQVLPNGATPITNWPNPNDAFLDVVKGIHRVVERLNAEPEPAALFRSRAVNRTKLLTYHCDRTEQEQALREKVLLHRQQRSTRPILCVIHGDEEECHDEFLGKLQEETLPKLLDLESKREGVKDFWLWDPPRHSFSPRSFWASLGNSLLGDDSTAPEKVWEFISNHKEPMMINLHLLAEDFDKGGHLLLRSFIEFCGNWPDLPPSRCVVICVCLKYERVETAGFFKNRKRRRLKAQIERTSFQNVWGLVLPELSAIPQKEVLWWSQSKKVREHCQLPEKQIRRWFDDKKHCNKEGRIPMELLAELLERI